MRVPIQIHVSLCISLRSRNFFTHRAVVATSAQCFGIGTRIHFEQLREDCVSTLRSDQTQLFQGIRELGPNVKHQNQRTVHVYRGLCMKVTFHA